MGMFVVVILLIAAYLVGSSVISKSRRKKRNARINEAVQHGRHTTGRVVAVETYFNQRTKTPSDFAVTSLHVRLEYLDPETGTSNTVYHVFPLAAPNLPLAIRNIGTRITDLGQMGAYIGETMAYRREMESQGLSKGEIDHMVMARARDRATGTTTGNEDEYGYVALAQPVEVDVYLLDSGPMQERLHVAFRP